MDRDELLNRRVTAIARTNRYTIADVHEALDAHPIELDRDKFLRRATSCQVTGDKAAVASRQRVARLHHMGA